ncbi:MAG: MmcQ/YjbR family DNA-binding protein [Candidatus Limnocylindria bacterium]
MEGEDPEAQSAAIFAALAETYLALPDVTAGTGFGGSPGLRRHGKIFAMLVRGSLVVKLPRERAEEIVASGDATAFDPGHGRLMREWIEVPVGRADDWAVLVEEAFQSSERLSRKG